MQIRNGTNTISDERTELEVMLHMAEPEIRSFLRLLKENAVKFPNEPGLTHDQRRALRTALCENWLKRYDQLGG